MEDKMIDNETDCLIFAAYPSPMPRELICPRSRQLMPEIRFDAIQLGGCRIKRDANGIYGYMIGMLGLGLVGSQALEEVISILIHDDDDIWFIDESYESACSILVDMLRSNDITIHKQSINASHNRLILHSKGKDMVHRHWLRENVMPGSYISLFTFDNESHELRQEFVESIEVNADIVETLRKLERTLCRNPDTVSEYFRERNLMVQLGGYDTKDAVIVGRPLDFIKAENAISNISKRLDVPILITNSTIDTEYEAFASEDGQWKPIPKSWKIL